jgi:hypothetical protein
VERRLSLFVCWLWWLPVWGLLWLVRGWGSHIVGCLRYHVFVLSVCWVGVVFAGFCSVPVVGVGWGLGVLVENWIVDASIFVAVSCARAVCACVSGVFFWVCGCVWCVWWQVMKGTWWMPWHQEPMKDVGACDKPWGVGNRAVIRGCPNGET